jgi:hypothetical protein
VENTSSYRQQTDTDSKTTITINVEGSASPTEYPTGSLGFRLADESRLQINILALQGADQLTPEVLADHLLEQLEVRVRRVQGVDEAAPVVVTA